MNTQEENFSTRLIELTGGEWCPYPSEMFIDVCSKVDDETFINLVKKRRFYLAPAFYDGREPMQEILQEELKKLNGVEKPNENVQTPKTLEEVIEYLQQHGIQVAQKLIAIVPTPQGNQQMEIEEALELVEKVKNNSSSSNEAESGVKGVPLVELVKRNGEINL